MNRKSHQNTDDRKSIRENFFNFRFHLTAFDILTLGVVMLSFGIILGWSIDFFLKATTGHN